MQKADLRKHYLQLWQKWLSDPQSIVVQQRLRERLGQFLKSQEGCWGFYKPMNDELNLSSLEFDCGHLKWVYPKIQKAGAVKEMAFFSAELGFQQSSWGLQEPITLPESRAIGPAGMIVPGIAFDRQGYRLGRGKGYYDVFLAAAKGIKDIQTVGVVPAQFLTTELPRDTWDQSMRWLVTEDEILAPKANTKGQSW